MTELDKMNQRQTVFEAILARRSVRSFTHREVDKITIQTLLEAAVRAPTNMLEEPRAFAIIQDRALLKHFSDLAKSMKGNNGPVEFIHPDSNLFHDAGTLILICSQPDLFESADCWLAAENLLLAACSIGLGTCIIGSSLAVLNSPESKTMMGIPEKFSVMVPIIVGFPEHQTAPSSRKRPFVLSWKASQ
ncbi:MAG TPA: nitroreductase family protein [Burkholderiales bacterium]|nr:nitroreductase family protein [Burkholderiales bacterium]